MDKDNMNKDENQVQSAPEAEKTPKDIKKKSAGKKHKGNIFHLKQLRYGSLSIVLTVVVIVLVMLVNYVFGIVETNLAWSVDLSYSQKFSISDETKEIVSSLDEDVKIFTLLQENSNSSLSTMLEEMLGRYKALGHISVSNLDIVANPTAAARFQEEDAQLSVNSIVVANADESKFRVISSEDMYDVEYTYDYNTGSYSYSKYDFVGEQAVTSAILYVTSDDTPIVHVLEGHGEVSLGAMSHVELALSAQNYEVKALNLTLSDTELEKGDVVMIVAPTSDLTDAEYDILKAFLEKGGRMYYASQYGVTSAELPNFTSLLGLYGLSVDSGLVVEDVNSTGRYYRQQLTLMPEIALTDAEGNQLQVSKAFDESSYLVLPQCQIIRTPEMKQSGIIYTNVLTTSDTAYIKSNVTENTTIDKQATDESGKFAVAVAMDRPDYDDSTRSTRIFVAGNAYYLAAESYYTAYDNSKLLISPMEWLVDRDTSVYVAGKDMGFYTMNIPDNTTYQILTITVIIAIPVIILLIGFIVWRRRRHL